MRGQDRSALTRLLRSGKSAQAMALAGQKMAGQALAVASTIVLLKLSSAQDYGTYIYAFVLVQIIAIFSTFGLVPLLVRTHARTHDESGRRIDGGAEAMGFAIIVTALLSVVGVAVMWLLATYTGKIPPSAIWLLPALGILRLLGGKLQGLGRLQLSQLSEALLIPLFMITAGAGLSIMLGRSLTADDLVRLYFAALIVCILFCVVALSRRKSAEDGERPLSTHEGYRSLANTAFAMGIGASVLVLNRQVDLLLVGTFLTPEMVAYYKVGAQIAYLVPFGLQIGSVILAREFAASAARSDLFRLKGTLRQAAILITAIALGVYGGIVLLGSLVASWMLAGPSTPTHMVMLILGAGLLFSAMAGNIGNLLNMTGNHWLNSRVMITSAVLNLALNYVLISWIGLAGAAIATCLTLIFTNLTQVIFARRTIGLSTDIVYALSRK